VYKSKRFLGIVPARGGSKGLTRKNIALLLGKPLIAWTLEQALASNYLDKVIVSTDDKEVADVSKKYGAEVPFLRPKSLATDNAVVIDAILHAIDWLEKHNDNYDLVMLLQPTSPLRTKEHIDKAIELLFLKKAQSIVSVCEAEHHPYLMNTLPLDGCMKDFLKAEVYGKNRQDLPIFYRLNGAIYLAYVSYLKVNNSFFGDKTYAFIMPRECSVDIDDELDFQIAELLLMEK
jgi:N-acylneuraminate cytidylyltransferase/CMP-N,N'-diacetyllegionaminic acid synthase